MRVLVVMAIGLIPLQKPGRVALLGCPNAKDRTIAAAYSVRGKPTGPVSAPVTWDELPDVQLD
jgi:DNA primase